MVVTVNKDIRDILLIHIQTLFVASGKTALGSATRILWIRWQLCYSTPSCDLNSELEKIDPYTVFCDVRNRP